MRPHTMADDLAEFDPHDPSCYLDNEAYDIHVDPAEREADVLKLVRRRQKNLALIAEADATVAEERLRWESWWEDRTAGLRREILRIENAIEQWQRGEGRLTFSTPYGVTPKLRETQGKVLVLDEKAVVEWALANGHTGLLKVQVRKAEIRKMPTTPTSVAVQLDGKPADQYGLLADEDEIVPGVALIVPAERSFSMGDAKRGKVAEEDEDA